MKVDVEVERAAEALDKGDCARARRERSFAACAATQVSEDHAQGNVERARDEQRVAGEKEARPARQGQDPLTHRHVRNHPVHEMSRGIVHPSGGAGRAEATPLARKRDQQLVAALGAAHPRKTMREDAAGEVTLELAHDEPGQARARLATLLHLGKEGLPVRAHGRVQERALGLAPPVARRDRSGDVALVGRL